MIKILQSWQLKQKINQDLKELKTIQEKAQEIECKLQKYMCENKQEFSKLSEDSEDVAGQFKIKNFFYPLFGRRSPDDFDDVVQLTVKMQKNEIISNIQDLKQRFDQLFQNSLDQPTQQGEDEQLVHLPNEQIVEVGKKALIGISKGCFS